MTGWAALAIDPADDVAVALRDIAAGEEVAVRCGDAVAYVVLKDPIALGHKLALRAVATGAAIHKYGERIGHATAPIDVGMHVHVHNLASARARSSG